MRKKGITKPDYLDSLPSGTVARSGTEVGVGGRCRGRRFRLATLLLFGAAGLAIVAIQSETGGTFCRHARRGVAQIGDRPRYSVIPETAPLPKVRS